MPEKDPRSRHTRLSTSVLDYHEKFIHHDNGFENILGLSSYFLRNASFERFGVLVNVIGQFQMTRMGHVSD